jgi:branched-subunit amino acid transport protein
MSTWIVVVVVGLGSYLLRYAPIVAVQRLTIPPVADRALRYAGPSAMAAMTVGAVLQHGRTHPPILAIGALLAVGVAAVVATRGRSFATVVVAGMAIYGLALVTSSLLTNVVLPT